MDLKFCIFQTQKNFMYTMTSVWGEGRNVCFKLLLSLIFALAFWEFLGKKLTTL